MTDDRIIRLPSSRSDETDDQIETRDPVAPDSRPAPDAEEGHDESGVDPLLREGPDAPDAADIEDPDEQL